MAAPVCGNFNFISGRMKVMSCRRDLQRNLECRLWQRSGVSHSKALTSSEVREWEDFILSGQPSPVDHIISFWKVYCLQAVLNTVQAWSYVVHARIHILISRGRKGGNSHCFVTSLCRWGYYFNTRLCWATDFHVMACTCKHFSVRHIGCSSQDVPFISVK